MRYDHYTGCQASKSQPRSTRTDGPVLDNRNCETGQLTNQCAQQALLKITELEKAASLFSL